MLYFVCVFECVQMCVNFMFCFFLKGWAEAEVLGVEEDLINFCVVMFHREHWWVFFFLFPCQLVWWVYEFPFFFFFFFEFSFLKDIVHKF